MYANELEEIKQREATKKQQAENKLFAEVQARLATVLDKNAQLEIVREAFQLGYNTAVATKPNFANVYDIFE